MISRRIRNAQVSQSFNGIWWSVKLPHGWSGHPENECATFRASPPLGVLQISSARKDTGSVTDQDLEDFAAQRIASGVRPKKVTYGQFSGFSAEHLKEESLWKEWWLRSGNLTVYATYIVAHTEKDLETDDVEEILGSLAAIK